ncbi:MAG TPA: GNAT family N-acetyltransferase [Symbiobacteriaceae bacterium]|nr:GNAT family N-acetyltransferase [Symbiobacteriaceae bacterium]
MGVVDRWRAYARQYGAFGLLRHLAAKLVRPVFEHAAVDILVLSPPGTKLSARASVDIAEMSPEQARTAGFWSEEWQRRWAKGDVCYGAWLQGVCIHHSWVTTEDAYVGEAHGHLRVPQGEAYVYDCFTSGQSRGLGVFPAVLAYISQRQFDRGVRRLWIAVETENLSSRRAIERAGFVPAGTLEYHRFGSGGKVTVHQASGQPPIPFS